MHRPLARSKIRGTRKIVMENHHVDGCRDGKEIATYHTTSATSARKPQLRRDIVVSGFV
jgi:hypothetical protein